MKTIAERISELQARLHEGRVNGSMDFDIIGDQARINELSMLSDNGDLRTIQVEMSDDFDIDHLRDTVTDALYMSDNVTQEQMDFIVGLIIKLQKTTRG
jgi:hypothetical protein